MKYCEICGKQISKKKFRHCLNCSRRYSELQKIKTFEEGGIVSEDFAKKYFIEKYGVCFECGIGTEWNGKSLILQLDHIDGNSDNSLKINLRLLCPNCHTQTETWCHRNTKNTKRRKFARVWRKNIINNMLPAPDEKVSLLQSDIDAV